MKAILLNKLAYSVTALSAIKVQVDKAGHFGDLYETASDALRATLSTFGEIRAEESADETVRICEKGDASLHVWANGLAHSVRGKGDVEVPLEDLDLDDGMANHDLGSIVIAGHEWHWAEVAEGAILRANQMFVDVARSSNQTGEKALPAAVFELAEFVESMHPHAEKEDRWTCMNFVLAANEVVAALRALPPMVAALAAEEHSQPPVGLYTIGNGRKVEGLAVAYHTAPEEAAKCLCKENRRSTLVVTAAGEVWSIYTDRVAGTSTATLLKLETHAPTGPYCKACDGPCKQSAGLISPSNDTTWASMPTAISILETLQHYEQFLGAGLTYPAVLDALKAAKASAVAEAKADAVAKAKATLAAAGE